MNRAFTFLKTAFAAAAVVLLLGVSSQVARAQSCAAPPPNMVSWWPGEGNANDIIDNNNGTPVNVTFAPGEVGLAFSFNGTSSEVDIPHNPNQNTGAQITIDAWINPTTITHGNPILNKRSSSNVGGYSFEATNSPFGNVNGLSFGIWIGGTLIQALTPANAITTGVWQHVAATYDGITMKIYVNGVLKASQAASGAIDAVTDPLVMGRNEVVSTADWDGLIDEVELFNRALTLSEIGAIYHAGSAGKCRPGTVYTVDYYANANTAGAPDATVRIVNPGTADDPASNGKEARDLCALIYVFDANQEMSECCGCYISANGLLTLSVNKNLTSNPLLGTKLQTGVIKIVSSTQKFNPLGCDPTVIGPMPSLRAWTTHIQNKVGTAFPSTEGESQSAVLGAGEKADLAEDCKVLEELGSGAGMCTCPAGH